VKGLQLASRQLKIMSVHHIERSAINSSDRSNRQVLHALEPLDLPLHTIFYTNYKNTSLRSLPASPTWVASRGLSRLILPIPYAKLQFPYDIVNKRTTLTTRSERRSEIRPIDHEERRQFSATAFLSRKSGTVCVWRRCV